MSSITANNVLSVLVLHIGKGKGISVRDLAYACTGQCAHASEERAVRQIITELRMDGHHICAHPSDGYFIAATAEELNETCKFLVDRSMTGLTQVSRMKKIALPDFYGQFQLLN